MKTTETDSTVQGYARRVIWVRGSALLAIVAALASAGPADAAPPANDDFEAAKALTTGVPVEGSNEEAGAQQGEPVHSTWVSANHSVWFTWTAPSSGLARVSSCGSDFDSVVAVYRGATLFGLFTTRLANNDSGCGAPTDAAVAYLRVQAGTTYRVVVDGWTASDAGNYQLVAEMLAIPVRRPRTTIWRMRSLSPARAPRPLERTSERPPAGTSGLPEPRSSSGGAGWHRSAVRSVSTPAEAASTVSWASCAVKVGNGPAAISNTLAVGIAQQSS